MAAACAFVPVAAHARDACIASYQTDRTFVRSAQEGALLAPFSDDLAAAMRLRIEEMWNPGTWRAPFMQARYDDMIHTVAVFEGVLGPDFTPEMRMAIIRQFTSPYDLTPSLKPLGATIEARYDGFLPLLERHNGALRFWEQFGVCASNSPYAYYRGFLETGIRLRAGEVGDDRNHSVAFREMLDAIPMRSLVADAGDPQTVIIVKRAYLPDRDRPLIRYAAPPCVDGDPPRNLQFAYDFATERWVSEVPRLPIRTWWADGFSDWAEIDMDRDPEHRAPTNPRAYAAMQTELAARFEFLQEAIGRPVEMPWALVPPCG